MGIGKKFVFVLPEKIYLTVCSDEFAVASGLFEMSKELFALKTYF